MNENAKTNRGGCGFWMVRIAGVIIAVIVVLLVIGCAVESGAHDRAMEQYPAPGEMVEVDGRMMHIQCAGEGSPTVILDAGQGGWSIDWGPIFDEISEETRVCAYDRAGYGWSEVADDARTPSDIARDLGALLDAAGIEGPYVVTGFSYTGLSTRIFAAQHPDEVVGMVLVDPAIEYDVQLYDENIKKQQQAAIGMFQGFTLLARAGIVRFMGPENMAPYAPFFPEDVYQPDVYFTFVAAPQWWQTSTLEFIANEMVLEDVAELGPIAADLPLVIIGAEYVGGPDDGFAELTAQRAEKLQEIAGRSSQGELRAGRRQQPRRALRATRGGGRCAARGVGDGAVAPHPPSPSPTRGRELHTALGRGGVDSWQRHRIKRGDLFILSSMATDCVFASMPPGIR